MISEGGYVYFGSAVKPVMKEFTGITSDSTLNIEFTPSYGVPDTSTVPVVNNIEIVSESGGRVSMNVTGR